MAIAMLTLGLKANSQTCTMSTTDPGANPALRSPLAVTGANGFTSPTQSPVGTYPKGQTSTLYSPVYSYNSAQTELNFKYHLASATSTATITSYTMTMYLDNGQVWTCGGTVSITLNTTGADYYFRINPPDAIPSQKYFRVSLSFTLLGGGNKDVLASAFQTNANLAPAGIILPVTFVSFEAKTSGDMNRLTWNVGTENNVKGYEVERSLDGRSFSTIGFVAATGAPSYSYTDAKTASAYYRIKSVDIDGKYGYSVIVAVKSEFAAIRVKVYPMPVLSTTVLEHGAAVEGARIEISAADGRPVKMIMPVAGNVQTTIDLSSAKAGLYLVRYTNNKQTETIKLIKQ